MDIKKTIIFSRHGLRYPLIYKQQFIDLFGHDITDWDFSDDEMGILTKRGELLEHKFGIYFREFFKGKKIDSIFSNSMRRTYLTARCIALGMMPYEDVQINTRLSGFKQMDLDFCLLFDNKKTVLQEKGPIIDKEFLPVYTKMEELLGVEKGTISDKKTTFFIDDDKFLHIRGALKIATDICDLFILKYYEGFDEDKIFKSTQFIKDIKFMSRAKDMFLDCVFSDKYYQDNANGNVYDKILKAELYSPNKFSLIVGHDSNLSLIFSKLGITYEPNERSIEKYPVGAKLIFNIFEDNSYEVYYTYFDYETIRGDKDNDPVIEFLKKGRL